MAFKPENFHQVLINPMDQTFRSVSNAPKGLYTYNTGDDTVAQVSASGYFNYFLQNQNTNIRGELYVSDWILVSATDGAVALKVTSVAGPITTADINTGGINTADLADNAVTTPKIADANVTLAKLAAGITPSHVVKYAAQYTTTGGGAAEGIAIAGVLATDLAFVQLVDGGTGTVTVSIAVCTADTLTVTFSGDPGNDAVINYQILRAAA